MNVKQDRILILDFGSQYTQLIARRVRECGVYSEIYACDCAFDAIKAFNPTGLILSGGPESVTESRTPRAEAALLTLGVPILGICYGMQTLAMQLGGQVESSEKREFGLTEITFSDNPLFAGLPQEAWNVWMSHGDKVTALPEGFTAIASSVNAPIVAMANTERHLYGLQFHPEVTHTEHGTTLLSNFVHGICGCTSSWTPDSIIDDAVAAVRAQVGSDKVLLGLSGGVDSSVLAALLHQAIGDQLVCVFVDNGLLRLGEREEVVQTFQEKMAIELHVVDASEAFLTALAGVVDPEAKRKVIGREFIEVFEQKASELAGIKWLAQGTIYPDVIESAGSDTGKAHVIKSHHNVGGLPEEMTLKLVEPLRNLFKDEVREMGVALGLCHERVYRHPFPGPALGVRVLGEVKADYLVWLRQADAIFIEALRDYNLYDQVAQAFAVFLPVKAVGVKGDARCYEYVIALRAVTTTDFMTAKAANLPHELLTAVANRIMNEVAGIARVTYDISSKPPATIEWE